MTDLTKQLEQALKEQKRRMIYTADDWEAGGPRADDKELDEIVGVE